MRLYLSCVSTESHFSMLISSTLSDSLLSMKKFTSSDHGVNDVQRTYLIIVPRP